MVTMQKDSSHFLNCAAFYLLTVDELSTHKYDITAVKSDGVRFLNSAFWSSVLDCNCLTCIYMTKNGDKFRYTKCPFVLFPRLLDPLNIIIFTDGKCDALQVLRYHIFLLH